MDVHALGPTIAQARDALRVGNVLLCFDIVERAAARGLRSPELEYLGILALAHCGNTQQALDRYHAVGQQGGGADQDWLALEGRLFKDLALQGGAAAHFMYERAAQSYWQAFQKTGGYFSAINAATMFMLADDRTRAEALARDVLALTQDARATDELERYNLHVSHAEAALLLGDADRCRKALRAANALARGHRAARARTVHQLRLICQHRRADRRIPALLTVPPQVCVFRENDIGITASSEELRAQAADLALPLPEINGTRVYICLLAPADLCIAELFLARGAEVSGVLPGSREEAMAMWQHRYGAAWAMRLAHGIGQMQELSETCGYLEREPQWIAAGVMARTLGLSRLLPDPIRTEWIGLAVTADTRSPGFALREMPASRLRELERALLDLNCPLSEEPRQAAVRTRRLYAVIAMTFDGVDTMSEAELPQYAATLMTALDTELSAFARKLVERRAWGATLRFVATDAAGAAGAALAMARCVSKPDAIAPPLRGLKPHLLLHFGPAYSGDDPIEGRTICYGTELSLAQALTVAVPAGAVFATEAFVARLLLEAPDTCRAAYVGEMPVDATGRRQRLFALQSP